MTHTFLGFVINIGSMNGLLHLGFFRVILSSKLVGLGFLVGGACG